MSSPTFETVIDQLLIGYESVLVLSHPDRQVNFESGLEAAAFAVRLHDRFKGTIAVQLRLPRASETPSHHPCVSWLRPGESPRR